jgi:drug/metabolite transporter (DMT)-like permease
MNGYAPLAAISLGAMMWGLWWWPMRLLEAQGLRVDWASLVLFALASALLAPLAWRRRATLRAGGGLLLAVGACIGGLLVMWNVALVVGDVVRVTLLFYLAPVWATVLGRLWLGDAVTPMRGLSIAFGLVGAAVALGFPGATGLPLPASVGDWLGLSCGIVFALALTLARLGARTDASGQAEGLGGFEQTFVAFVVGAVGSALFVAVNPAPPPEGAAIAAGVPLAAAIAVVWLLPQLVLVLWAAARLDPGRAAILMLLEVVAAAISATLIAGDLLTWRDAVGCALILTAGVLEARGSRRESAAVSA